MIVNMSIVRAWPNWITIPLIVLWWVVLIGMTAALFNPPKEPNGNGK